MEIVDSNIVIYAAIDEFAHLRTMIRERNPVVSEISKLEVLGYHELQDTDFQIFETIFADIRIISISSDIIDRAVGLRRAKRMSIGDAIIASTALEHDLKLITKNTKDFNHISDLQVVNPFQG